MVAQTQERQNKMCPKHVTDSSKDHEFTQKYSHSRDTLFFVRREGKKEHITDTMNLPR